MAQGQVFCDDLPHYVMLLVRTGTVLIDGRWCNVYSPVTWTLEESRHAAANAGTLSVAAGPQDTVAYWTAPKSSNRFAVPSYVANQVRREGHIIR